MTKKKAKPIKERKKPDMITFEEVNVPRETEPTRETKPVTIEQQPEQLKPWEEKVIAAYMQNGGNQRKAYRTGKPISEKWLDKTVDSKASEFFAQGKVQERLAEMTQLLRDEVQISLQEMYERHMNIIELCSEPGELWNPAVALKGLDQVGRSQVSEWYEKESSTVGGLPAGGLNIQIQFVDA